MVVFDPDDQGFDQDLAYQLLADGPVTLFWRMAVLEETVGWLADHGYQIVRIDSSTWTSDLEMHRQIAEALDFPRYTHTLDALNDYLRDIAEGRAHHHSPDWRPDPTGIVIVLTSFDTFASGQRHLSHRLLDIMAAQSRQALLFGRRILCLLQSNDPDLMLKRVGAMSVEWNEAEWRTDARRRGGTAVAPAQGLADL
jgi:hypothetical protein